MAAKQESGLKQRFMAGAATMGGARILEQAAVFARNLIIANLLGAENQGIATTFAIVLSFVEMWSDLGVGRLLVQADDGEDPALQASLHSWGVARGVVLGLLLLAIADPVSKFFHVPAADWAFRMLAVVPFLKGFEHLDLRRFQRRMQFGRLALSTLIPQVLTAVLAWPLATYFGDYSAALYLVILQVFASVGASHWFAERPFRLGMRAEHVRRLLAFGLPLMMNGMVLFAVLQGDRAIVGHYYTPADLGVYSIAAGLALMSGNLLMSVVTPLALPALSQTRNDPARYRLILGKMMDLSLACAVPIAMGAVILGPPFLRLIYQSDYWPAEFYIGVLGLAAALRMLRIVPNSAQMAHGENMVLFYASMARVLGTALVLAVAVNGGSLVAVAWCGAAGEIAALVTTAGFLQHRQKVGLRTLASAVAWVLVFYLMGWGATHLPFQSDVAWVNLLSGIGQCAVLMAVLLLVRPTLRGEVMTACLRLLRLLYPTSKRT